MRASCRAGVIARSRCCNRASCPACRERERGWHLPWPTAWTWPACARQRCGRAGRSPLADRRRRPRELLPRGEAEAVERRADSETPLLFTLSAAGTQRLDRMEPIGTAVRLQRRLETLDGKPLAGPMKPG